MIRSAKVERGQRIASLPEAAQNAILAGPRGLDRILADLNLSGSGQISRGDEQNDADRFDESFEGRR